MSVFRGPTGLLVLGIIALVWLAGVIYLLFTGKRDKRGITKFIIAAGGFGAIFGVEGSGGETDDLIRWSESQIVTLERKSPRWHRMKIEETNDLGQLKTQFDAVVRCNEDQALEIKRVIDTRIADSSRDRA